MLEDEIWRKKIDLKKRKKIKQARVNLVNPGSTPKKLNIRGWN